METRVYKITAAQLPQGDNPYQTLLDQAYAPDQTLDGFEVKAVFWDRPVYGQNDVPALILIFQKSG